MDKSDKEVGLVKESKKNYRLSKFVAGLLLETGVVLSFIGSVIGLSVTNNQANQFYNSQDVQLYRQELILEEDARLSSGEISEEEYTANIEEINSKKNDSKYADIVFGENAEYRSIVKNYENCRKATDITYITTLVGVGILGLASKYLDDDEYEDNVTANKPKKENDEVSIPITKNDNKERLKGKFAKISNFCLFFNKKH